MGGLYLRRMLTGHKHLLAEAQSHIEQVLHVQADPVQLDPAITPHLGSSSTSVRISETEQASNVQGMPLDSLSQLCDVFFRLQRGHSDVLEAILKQQLQEASVATVVERDGSCQNG